MSNKSPIGIFDSGVGGTSIWKEIHQLLPHEHTIYLADSANAPYGARSKAEILNLSIKNTKLLRSLGCKIIVVACNTATTNAIDELRRLFDIPFIGIEPAIKPAALQTHSKSIGILATKGTLSSELFHKTSRQHTYGIKVTEIIGEGLVPLIERGELHSEELTALLRKFTEPMIRAKIDYLVLGCSHYPYLIPQLKEMLPNYVKIIDSGEAAAKQTKAVLRERALLANRIEKPKLEFFSNSETSTIQQLLKDYESEIAIKRLDF